MGDSCLWDLAPVKDQSHTRKGDDLPREGARKFTAPCSSSVLA